MRIFRKISLDKIAEIIAAGEEVSNGCKRIWTNSFRFSVSLFSFFFLFLMERDLSVCDSHEAVLLDSSRRNALS